MDSFPSGLYVLATPIGNLKDITLRALDVLKACDGVLCEDTRVTQKLLSHHGIRKPLIPYHEHNHRQIFPAIEKKLTAGERLALLSDAGTPLISDPGDHLVRLCYDAGFYVTTLPGPSAVIASLTISGLPSKKFFFAGFYDTKEDFRNIPHTLIFFESPRRLLTTLKAMKTRYEGRTVSVVREITKIHEEVHQGTFDDLIIDFQATPPRGEIVIILSPPAEKVSKDISDEEILSVLKTKTLRDAVDQLSNMYNLHRKDLYRRALHLKERTVSC